jgi:hypothetical protein
MCCSWRCASCNTADHNCGSHWEISPWSGNAVNGLVVWFSISVGGVAVAEKNGVSCSGWPWHPNWLAWWLWQWLHLSSGLVLLYFFVKTGLPWMINRRLLSPQWLNLGLKGGLLFITNTGQSFVRIYCALTLILPSFLILYTVHLVWLLLLTLQLLFLLFFYYFNWLLWSWSDLILYKWLHLDSIKIYDNLSRTVFILVVLETLHLHFRYLRVFASLTLVGWRFASLLSFHIFNNSLDCLVC